MNLFKKIRSLLFAESPPTKEININSKLTTIGNTLDYKLIYIAKFTTLDYVKEYLSYFGQTTVDNKINEFINNGLLKEASMNDKLYSLTVPELKKILKAHSLKVSGNKPELLDRILENIPETEYIMYLPKDTYIARTPTGEQYYKELLNRKDTILYNTFFKLADYIVKKDYYSANNLGTEFYKANNIKHADSNAFRIDYEYIPNFETAFTKEYGKYVYAALTSCNILGKSRILDVVNEYLQSHNLAVYDDNSFHNIYLYYMNLKTLCQYKNEGVTHYEISVCDDADTCNQCKKMNGMRFKISSAAKGATFPPFCNYCRCTILPVIDEDKDFDKEWQVWLNERNLIEADGDIIDRTTGKPAIFKRK